MKEDLQKTTTTWENGAKKKKKNTLGCRSREKGGPLIPSAGTLIVLEKNHPAGGFLF